MPHIVIRLSRIMSGFALFVLLGPALGACAKTEIVQTAQNRAVISTSAAPVCGTEGALRVAQQMAAVATLRQGFDRFLLGGVGSHSDVRVSHVPGNYSYTTGTLNRTGNYGSFNAQTYRPTTTVVTGRNRAQMEVLMLRPRDPRFHEGLDARRVLGPKWRDKVVNGIDRC